MMTDEQVALLAASNVVGAMKAGRGDFNAEQDAKWIVHMARKILEEQQRNPLTGPHLTEPE